MTDPPVALTTLSRDQRAQAQTRWTIIRPALEDGVSQAQVARTHTIPVSTIKRWVKRYGEKGLVGLADVKTRSDKGKSRRLPPDAITLIEGLALQTPPRSMAAIHRQVTAIATEQGWNPPSYDRVRQIIKNLDPALMTFAHQGAAAYREEFDVLYRREATHANAMWQADHTPLDVWLLVLQSHLKGSSGGQEASLLGKQDLQDACPQPLFEPALIATGHRRPRSKALREFPPGGGGARHPEHGFHDEAMVTGRPTCHWLLRGQERTHLLPEFVREGRKPQQLDGRWQVHRNGRGLPPPLQAMEVLSALLVLPAKMRPVQASSLLFLRLAQRLQ
jgi:transposase-like protein